MSHYKNAKLNASDVGNKLLDLFPNVKQFLQVLVRDVDVEIKQVGPTFEYPFLITKNYLYSNYGIFMDYFIRKHLSQQYQMELSDVSTQHILSNPKEYFKSPGKDEQLRKDITKHYEIFKDSRNKAMDILESIRIVSLTYTMSIYYPLPKAKVQSDNENLWEIIKYFQKLPYTSMEMKSDVNCEYFNGNADFIFDQKVLYGIKASQCESLKRFDTSFKIQNFYEFILYGFGWYKKTKKIIKCYKIYNPLLGLEYTVHLDDIDMMKFELVLKKDIEEFFK